jgi:type III pantothenate kinase
MHRGVIDIGNTRIKAAVFSSEGELVNKQYFNDLSSCYQWLKQENIYSVIVSSVAQGSTEEVEGFEIHSLSYLSKLPFKNQYLSKETLGVDRIAALAAAATQFPNQACLIFDIGTCMTIDFLDPELNYYGGNISPGIDLRLKAMHQMTGRLPLIDLKDANFTMGSNTKEAMANGVLLGMQYEIEGYIQTFTEKYPNLQTVLCGGDHPHFVIPSKYKIFANENFVLEGLHALLLLNEK